MISDLPTGDKFNIQFPLPGHVGFATTQPVLGFTKSEAIDSHLKPSSAEVIWLTVTNFDAKIAMVRQNLGSIGN